MTRKSIWLWVMVALALAACASPAAPPTPTDAPLNTATALPPTATLAPPTATSAPTDTALPTKTTAPTETSAPSPTATALPSNTPTLAGPVDYAPTVSSVWNFVQGPDQISGSCSGPHLPPYGLVQLIPEANGLTWRSQEIAPYAFAKVRMNVYAYSGPTAAGDGTAAMTLTFTGPTTLVMRRTFTPSAEPGCSHTHDYAGTFQWASN